MVRQAEKELLRIYAIESCGSGGGCGPTPEPNPPTPIPAPLPLTRADLDRGVTQAVQNSRSAETCLKQSPFGDRRLVNCLQADPRR